MCCVRVSDLPTRETAASASVSRRRRTRWASAASLLMCCTAGLLASGCSMSFPIAGFTTDAVVTGSTNAPDALLFKALDQEDWRRAKAAMAVALDPQGNGASVGWDNPKSGARGSFVAAAEPQPAADLICRTFQAHMALDSHSGRDIRGSACRNTQGEWLVRSAAEVGKAKG